jgi:hypothetical protein
MMNAFVLVRSSEELLAELDDLVRQMREAGIYDVVRFRQIQYLRSDLSNVRDPIMWHFEEFVKDQVGKQALEMNQDDAK